MLAKRDCRCFACRGIIPAGSGFYAFRERALSSREACHAGAYPMRYVCCACAADRRIRAQAQPVFARVSDYEQDDRHIG